MGCCERGRGADDWNRCAVLGEGRLDFEDTGRGVTEANLGGLLFARCPSAPFPDNTQLPLNSEAAMTLQTAPQMDEAHREKTLLEHLPQVQYIARRIHDRLPPQVLLEDLVHAGIIGLIDAVKKYDPSKN